MTRKEWLELGCLDTPEQVAECISCPLPDCVNCQSRGGLKGKNNNRRKVHNHNWDKALALELWKAGKLDTEIAQEVGCSKVTIYAWRRREGLQANYWGE